MFSWVMESRITMFLTLVTRSAPSTGMLFIRSRPSLAAVSALNAVVAHAFPRLW